jgi:hypothetical protein
VEDERGYHLIPFPSIMYRTTLAQLVDVLITFYINFVMTLVGFFETFGAGWIYGLRSRSRAWTKGWYV